MVAHCGGSHGDDVAPKMPDGTISSSSSSGGAKPALKKGPWTAAEDAFLMEYVKKNGEGNWNAVQKNTSLARCGKSCRLRWTNHLRPNLKKGAFTPEEERLILQLHAQLGNKWARMATQLPGRTDNEIKNYWNTRIKRRIRQGLPLYPNDLASQNHHQQQAMSAAPMQQFDQHHHHHQPAPAATAAAIRGRPLLQIQTRNISQFLAQSHSPSPSPTPSPIPLSPQTQNHLQTTFSHSLSLFDPATSPLSGGGGGSGLPSPHSPAILSLTGSTHLLLSPYHHQHQHHHHHDPNSSFPGFSTSPLTLPTTTSSLQFINNPLNFNLNSPHGLHPPPLSPCAAYNNNIDNTTTTTPLKSVELPSNQFFEPESNPNPGFTQSSSIGLLEQLLEQASNEHAQIQQHSSNNNNNLFNVLDHKFDFSLTENCSSAAEHANAMMGIKNEPREESGGGPMMHEELSKLLQSIPSPANIITNELNNLDSSLNIPSLEFGSCPAASDDSLGLDVQQLTSLFQSDHSSSADVSRPSWNNLPRIC